MNRLKRIIFLFKQREFSLLTCILASQYSNPFDLYDCAHDIKSAIDEHS